MVCVCVCVCVYVCGCVCVMVSTRVRVRACVYTCEGVSMGSWVPRSLPHTCTRAHARMCNTHPIYQKHSHTYITHSLHLTRTHDTHTHPLTIFEDLGLLAPLLCIHILNSQCPSIFSMSGHHSWDFSEFVPAARC